MWSESQLQGLARIAVLSITILLQFLASRPDPELEASLVETRDLILDRVGAE
jgi:hypothetical protein